MDRTALSLPILISLAVGNMIGTGIYVLPASLAQYGTVSLFSWLYTALGAMCIALTLARLNKRFPKTGGPYVYCKEAYGKPICFFVAYMYWICNAVSIAGLAVASVSYLGFIMPILDSNNELYKPHAALILELCVVWGFTYVNILSIHIVNLVQFTPNHMTYFSAISGAAALTFWAFIGLEAATIPAENTRGNKDIARATIYGTLLTSFIYIVSTFVLMGMIPLSQLQNSQFPFSIASTLLFGHMGAILVTGCAVISGLGALNVCVLLQGQIVFAAARDNVFPSMFAKLSKNDVPISGQLLSSGLVTLLLIFTIEPMLLNQFNYIALLAALLALITYLITSFSEIKFLYVEMNNKGQLILNKKFLIPILAVLYSLWMLISLEEKILFAGSIILVIFIPIYFLTVKRQG